MKKFLLALALIASVQVAGAQSKSPAAAKKAVESAAAATQNPKKAAAPATWIKLGKAYLDAYNVPTGSLWLGAARQELAYVMGNDKPVGSETVELQGEVFTKDIYADKDLYFNQNGQLAIIVVTAPVYEDALAEALVAYTKAAELDPAGKKSKDIIAGIKTISEKYTEEAYNEYTFGNFEKASYKFEASAKASEVKPFAQVDTTAFYNAAFTAWAVQNYERAEKLFNVCLDYGYYYNDGEVYAKLGDIADKTGNKEAQVKYLEEGFQKFPQSQSILIGLINYYISSNSNTDRLFELLAEAKANEPENVSLYYVEGNIHLQLGQEDEAVAAYRKCSEINPAYEFGFIGEGILFYNKAVELQEKASNEYDDNKYMLLQSQFEQALKNCIEPFEHAFEVTKDETVKVSVADYLKNACYRFSDDELYNEKYQAYKAVCDSAK